MTEYWPAVAARQLRSTNDTLWNLDRQPSRVEICSAYTSLNLNPILYEVFVEEIELTPRSRCNFRAVIISGPTLFWAELAPSFNPSRLRVS